LTISRQGVVGPGCGREETKYRKNVDLVDAGAIAIQRRMDEYRACRRRRAFVARAQE
jgi:hypothetical protein